MKVFINYIIEAGLSLGIFTLIYWFVLRHETRFKATRFYLLFALLFSTLLPFVTIRINLFNRAASPALNEISGGVQGSNLLESVTVYASGFPAKISYLLLSVDFSLLVYVMGAFIALFVISLGFFQLWKIVSKNRIFQLKKAKLVVASRDISPYSFFNYVFISKNLVSEEHWKSMVYHELEHVKQGHSFDVLFIDLMMIFQWFNPFYWLLRRWVRENHEFLADTGVLARGSISGAQYKKLLLSQVIGGRPFITSNFFNVKTVQKRFKMITKNKKQRFGWLRYTTGVIVALLFTLMFACEQNDAFNEQVEQASSYVYMGRVLAENELDELGVASMKIIKVETPEAIKLFPEIEGKVHTKVTALVFDMKDERQNKLSETLNVEALTRVVNEADEVVVVAYGKNVTYSNDEVHIIVDEMPEFPGGELELRKFIAKNVAYPVEAANQGISGRVYVSFVVAKDGSVEDVIVVRGVDSSLDNEALRVVSSLPKWIPGKMNGEAVKVAYTVPINFQLQ
jgi:TonB family protein